MTKYTLLALTLGLASACSPGTPGIDCPTCNWGGTDTAADTAVADSGDTAEASDSDDIEFDDTAVDDTAVDDNPDGDGDGYSAEPDCDDENAEVNPGADEDCSNGIDDDCDGLADEADDECDEPQSEDELKVSASYPSSADLLTLNVQPIWEQDELGDWWYASETVLNDDSVEMELHSDFSTILGVRLNITKSEDTDNDGDYDSYVWLCNGHNETAVVDGSVGVEIALNGDSWYEGDLVAWSPEGDDVSDGCSALLWFGDTSDINNGQVTD